MFILHSQEISMSHTQNKLDISNICAILWLTLGFPKYLARGEIECKTDDFMTTFSNTESSRIKDRNKTIYWNLYLVS